MILAAETNFFIEIFTESRMIIADILLFYY